MKFITKIVAFFFAAIFPIINSSPTVPQKETGAEMPEIAFAECAREEVAYAEVAELAPDGEYDGIKAVTFDGFCMGGMKTKIFAYLAFPEDAGADTPAVVLVHGGGGHAYLEWVKQWLDAGYAVIAPDVTGYFPTEKNAGATTDGGKWTHALYGVFAEDGYTVIPDNDGMAHSSDAIENQWMYHAVGAVIRSFSILSQSGRVAQDKIGVVGVSWGAVITSVFLGYDSRCAFAVPIYGSAYLADSLSYMKEMFAEDATRALWSAEDRLGGVTCPILWLCADRDGNFSLNSNSMSYLSTAKNGGTRLSVITGMQHSHESAWERKEPLVFADSVVRGAEPMPEFVTLPTGESTTCEVRGATRARLYYITEELTYSMKDGADPHSTMPDQAWQRGDVTMDGGMIYGEIPSDAVMYYISVTGNGCTVSTPLIRAEK